MSISQTGIILKIKQFVSENIKGSLEFQHVPESVVMTGR